MSELKKYEKSVPSGGMERPASSGGNSGYITKTPPKPEMEKPVVAEGTLDGFGKWTLDDAGLLVIDGKGEMPDWSSASYTPWERMGKAIKQVHISDGVTSIGDWAFAYCHSLTSVHIPDSVTSVGMLAFERCESLTSIHVPDSVTTIGSWAFSYCKSLTSIHIPDSVKTLGYDVFNGCNRLRQVTMPKHLNCLLFKWNYGIPKSIVTFY